MNGTMKPCLAELDKMTAGLCDKCDEEPVFEIAGMQITQAEFRNYLKKVMSDTIVPIYYLDQWEEFIIDYTQVLQNCKLDKEEGHPLYQMYLWFLAIQKDGKVMLA